MVDIGNSAPNWPATALYVALIDCDSAQEVASVHGSTSHSVTSTPPSCSLRPIREEPPKRPKRPSIRLVVTEASLAGNQIKYCTRPAGGVLGSGWKR